jgi:hypothetical protein
MENIKLVKFKISGRIEWHNKMKERGERERKCEKETPTNAKACDVQRYQFKKSRRFFPF